MQPLLISKYVREIFFFSYFIVKNTLLHLAKSILTKVMIECW